MWSFIIDVKFCVERSLSYKKSVQNAKWIFPATRNTFGWLFLYTENLIWHKKRKENYCVSKVLLKRFLNLQINIYFTLNCACPLNVNKISFKAHTYIRQGKIRYWSKGTTLCGTRRKYQNKLHKVKKIFCDIMKIRWIVRIFWCLAEMSPIAFWRF